MLIVLKAMLINKVVKVGIHTQYPIVRNTCQFIINTIHAHGQKKGDK